METQNSKKFQLRGVCAKDVQIQVAHGVILAVEFNGGCLGSLTALCKALVGMSVEKAYTVLIDTPCRPTGTSCPMELAEIIAKQYLDDKK